MASEPTYEVVINHELQYSIWPSARDLPQGWDRAGFNGTRDDCLDHIETEWIDMRPLSVRKWMDEQPD